MRFIVAVGIYTFLTWLVASKMDPATNIVLFITVFWGLFLDIEEMTRKNKK